MRQDPFAAWRHGLRFAGAFALASLLSCSGGIPDLSAENRTGGIDNILVSVTDVMGSVSNPLPYSTTGVPFTLHIEAHDASGNILTSFNGYLALSVTPGTINSVTGPTTLGNYVQLSNGVVDGVVVTISEAFGQVRILAEDSGYTPVDPTRIPPPQCANGIDDNHNGLTDYPADPGCAAANDDSEDGGSYTVGSSQPLFFTNPLISDVTGHADTSPLAGDRVALVGRSDPMPPTAASPLHRLVVTGLDNSGFYVTDIDDTSCMGMPCYNSIYAYNFNPPSNLFQCDQISSLVGSVSVFVSYNELNEPGYIVGLNWTDPAPGAVPTPQQICNIPPAVVLTPTTIASQTGMASLESSMVQVQNAIMPTVVGPGLAPMGIPAAGATDCDLNGDGRITYDGGAEQQCADMCEASPTCTEWSEWITYGQIYVTLPQPAGSTLSRILVSPKSVVPEFDPQHPVGATVTVTGAVRRTGATGWDVQPRCLQDFVVANDGQMVVAANASCLDPNAGMPTSTDF